MNKNATNMWSAIGPGLIFAGTAVGVSHLVQSTRAGASYGFAFVALVVLANLIKYPAFRFGTQYAAATGTSLLQGYRRQGRWVLVFYALLTLLTMFTIQAGVTMVTAGLAIHLLHAPWSVTHVSMMLMSVCGLFLAFGNYRVFERLMKIVVLFLTLSTLVATGICLTIIDFSDAQWWPTFSTAEPASLLFAAALIGWMPSAIDISVWQSIWTLEKQRVTQSDAHENTRTGMRAALFDFHLGYIGTAMLALCFVIMGAVVMHQNGAEPAPGAAAFAGQLVDLYGQTLGQGFKPIIATCTFLVMLSTTLTVTDGFPRAIEVLVERFCAEAPVPESTTTHASSPPLTASAPRAPRRVVYWTAMLVIGAGAGLVIAAFASSMRALIDVATTLSFLTGPVLAWLNHRAVTGPDVRVEDQPRRWLVLMSLLGISIQAVFAVGYLCLIIYF